MSWKKENKRRSLTMEKKRARKESSGKRTIKEKYFRNYYIMKCDVIHKKLNFFIPHFDSCFA
jgi:hypothetical protein